MRKQSLPYTWTIGIPISILGLLQGILLILSVKLPEYPSNPRSRVMILLSWLIITMIEINLAAIFTVVIFAVLILLGKCRVSKYIELFWEGSNSYNEVKPTKFIIMMPFLDCVPAAILVLTLSSGTIAFICWIWRVVQIFYRELKSKYGVSNDINIDEIEDNDLNAIRLKEMAENEKS